MSVEESKYCLDHFAKFHSSTSLFDRPIYYTVADFGCGEARLAQSISQKCYSLDLVASNSNVIACDMAHTPLQANSINIAVFCLSLMGTNLKDFLIEANRVLRNGQERS